MNSKHIFIIASEFPPQPGGIGNHAFNLASQLSDQNFNITVLADYRADTHSEENKFDAAQNFKVIRIPRYYFIIRTYVERINTFRKYVKLNNPDVVIASGKFPLWLVAFGKKRAELKKIAIIHGSEVNLKIGWQQKLVERALKQFDQIITVSNHTKSLIKHLNLDKIAVITNGFEIRKFQKVVANEELQGNPKFVTVGNISQRKGQHNVITKLPALLKMYPDLHYHMVGIPSEKEKLLQLARRLDVEKNITFHGAVDQLKLNAILGNSDIFVMLSEKTALGDVEGFGIAILEANYMGLPAIGAMDCGIEDAVKNYKSGILIHFDDTKAFGNAVQDILKNKETYSENAKKWALEHTWEISIEKYIKLISTI